LAWRLKKILGYQYLIISCTDRLLIWISIKHNPKTIPAVQAVIAQAQAAEQKLVADVSAEKAKLIADLKTLEGTSVTTTTAAPSGTK
jgi:hypothetical protein